MCCAKFIYLMLCYRYERRECYRDYCNRVTKVTSCCVTDTSAENVTETIVTEGLVEVRRGGLKPSEYVKCMKPYCQCRMVI